MKETSEEHPATKRLWRIIGRWMAAVLLTDDYWAYKRKTLSRTLWYDDVLPPEEPEGNYDFGPVLRDQHDLIVQWMNLQTSILALEKLQYYFRRYPFHGLPVTRADHAQMVAEMYFSSFYAIRERSKKFLNGLNEHGKKQVNVGAFLKWFDREFDGELRWRNQVHHHRPFDDIAIDRLSITELLKDDGDNEGWKDHQRRAYRAFTKEWSDRVARKSLIMKGVLNEISGTVITVADFLRPYDDPVDDEVTAK